MAENLILKDAAVAEQAEEKDDDKKKKIETGDQELNPEALHEMLMTSMGDGTLEEINPEEDDIDKRDKTVEYKHKEKTMEPLGIYADKVVEDVMNNPAKYSVQTSKGEMNLKDALEEGWDPESDSFDDTKNVKRKKEDALSQVSASDRANIEKMLSPENAKIPPGEASQYGLPPGHPLTAQQGGSQEEMPGLDPSALEGMVM